MKIYYSSEDQNKIFHPANSILEATYLIYSETIDYSNCETTCYETTGLFLWFHLLKVSASHSNLSVGWPILPVSSSTPVSVTSMVCSNCADLEPSFVTAVQPKGETVERDRWRKGETVEKRQKKEKTVERDRGRRRGRGKVGVWKGEAGEIGEWVRGQENGWLKGVRGREGEQREWCHQR